MTTSQINPDVYQAGRQTAVLTDRSDLGMLVISGETRFDLLNRMSTQKIAPMQKGEGTATILTTDIGRIIDRLLIYATDNSLYTITSENNSTNIARYLMRYVFFQDDFHIQDISKGTMIFGVYGPQACEKLMLAGFAAEGLPLHHWRKSEFGDIYAYIHRTDPIHGEGYFVISQEENREFMWQQLLDVGLPVADAAAFDYLRIEAGLPRFGQEITGDYIPLEANLWDDVSFKKGCYIGQEIIARMESRGKLAKKLVRLAADSPLALDSVIKAEGKNAGTLTSTAVGPNGAIGLGYVKTAVLEANTQLCIGDTPVQVAT